MAQTLTIDYSWQKDTLYLRTERLPEYRVREPAPWFLVYVVGDPQHGVVGFEILDFADYPLEDHEAELTPYLRMTFDVPELGLKNTLLGDLLTTIRRAIRYSQPQHPHDRQPVALGDFSREEVTSSISTAPVSSPPETLRPS